ncbi:MAG: hypothetical protein JWL70_531 [Acidimicrobiia bacterium]|nr:hypothetical protein [Acidimicrobiia bacterium]
MRRVDPANIGDVGFGICLFLSIGHLSVARIAGFIVVTVLGSVVLAAFLVVAGSLTFFARGSNAGDLGFNAILMLAAYPVDVFAGASKAIVYTAVPAAFVATVPARVVVHGGLVDLALLAGVAAVLVVAAFTSFTLGLRRYTGTSLWTRA